MTYVNRLALSVCAASLVALGACEPFGDPAAPPSDPVSQETLPEDTETAETGAAETDGAEAEAEAEAPPQAAGLSGAVFALEGAALAEALQPAPGLEITPTGAGAAVSGVMADPVSTGRTGGAHVMIPAEMAARFAGRTVTVTLLARSPDGAGLQAAYSTAQRGNSRWRALALGEGFAPVSFDYAVPAPGEAQINADFIGLAPDGGAIEIAALTVTAAD